MLKKTLIASITLATLVVATPALAGPPFICHPFDIGTAKSLPWGATNNYLAMRDDYDFHNVVADAEKLLTPSMPTIVRMETLRRAAIYASRDRAVATQFLGFVMGRATSLKEPGRPEALAWFDAGYVIEALSELEQVGHYEKQLRGLETVLAGLTDSFSGRALIEKSATLRPDDAAIEFALGLISRAPESDKHFDKARVASHQDALLANNLARLQLQ
jgi:hypothetical protein